MIDAATFASQYSAFWRIAAPTSELLIRRINMGQYERFATPLKVSGSSADPALVAETGFCAFELMIDNFVLRDTPGELISQALASAKSRLRASYGLVIDLPLEGHDANYALALCDRLYRFFASRKQSLIIRPAFIGCGFVDASEGDVVSGDTLFEIKAVERGFRSSDIFQLLSYYALARSAFKPEIANLGVVNPKRGTSFEISADQLCRSVSGSNAFEMSGEIIRAISSGDISR